MDDSRDEALCIFSALAIPVDEWREVFQQIREWRRELKRTYGIYVYKELHAWKFISGRGRPSDRIITKSQRAAIFRQGLQLIAGLPGARLFNVAFPRKGERRAFERILNRMDRTLQAWASHAILFCDEGKEVIYTRLVRKMAVFNPIPSQFGRWRDTGETYRNIPITRIIEDPVFKRSAQSYFIQLVDFAAYALLRKERPLDSKTRYGIDQGFAELSPILVREATRYDPEGIIRP